MNLKEELLERYHSTGRVGFCTPKTLKEAYSLIDTIVKLYEQATSTEKEEVVLSLSVMTQKLMDFLQKF